jgi:hypothetical protein
MFLSFYSSIQTNERALLHPQSGELRVNVAKDTEIGARDVTQLTRR